MAKKHRSRKSQQDPAVQIPLSGPDKEARSSPVCYARAPELRPEFLTEEDVASTKPEERLELAKPATDNSK